MLDEQEKQDLVRLYKKWKAHNKKLEQKFLEVLKYAGCEEEIRNAIDDISTYNCG